MHCTSLLLQSRYFEYMKVYVLPTGCREVGQSVGAVGKFLVECEVEKQRSESQTVSRGQKYCEAEDSSCTQMENDNK